MYLALDVAELVKPYRDLESWPTYVALMESAPWWDTLDWIAGKIMSLLILEHRELEQDLIRWRVDENMWVRRASLLAHLKHKAATNTELAGRDHLDLGPRRGVLHPQGHRLGAARVFEDGPGVGRRLCGRTWKGAFVAVETGSHEVCEVTAHQLTVSLPAQPSGKSARLTKTETKCTIVLMRIVADTNTFIAVALNQPEKDLIVRLAQGSDLIAPEVLPFEIGNALTAMKKRGVLQTGEVIAAWKMVQAIPVDLRRIDIASALEIATEFNIQAYDAYFLECASRLRSPLLTLDRGMKRIAVDLGLTVLE